MHELPAPPPPLVLRQLLLDCVSAFEILEKLLELVLLQLAILVLVVLVCKALETASRNSLGLLAPVALDAREDLINQERFVLPSPKRSLPR